MASRLGSQDTQCHFCGEAVEIKVHLFLECPLAKAIWFGCRWYLRSNGFLDPLSYSPDHAQRNEDLNTQWTVQVALTLETIWFLRNQIAHNKGNINLPSTIHELNLKAQEHLESLNVVDKDKRQGTTCWTCPLVGKVKLNVDAAICKDYTTLAVVA